MRSRFQSSRLLLRWMIKLRVAARHTTAQYSKNTQELTRRGFASGPQPDGFNKALFGLALGSESSHLQFAPSECELELCFFVCESNWKFLKVFLVRCVRYRVAFLLSLAHWFFAIC